MRAATRPPASVTESPIQSGSGRDSPTVLEGTNLDDAGLIGVDGCNVAVVTTASRGYWIQLYTSGDDPIAVAPYDRAWFDGVLSTVQLHPGDAVD